jgi:uncharacterized membrane protein
VGPRRPRRVMARRTTGRIGPPAFLLGVGLGGLVDGVVLHQILQWHHMLTSTGDHPANTVAGLEANTLADGLFHLGTILVLLIGVALLWQRLREGTTRSWRSILGFALVGWGAFNLVEGLIDHEILGIHHVRSGPDHLAWDLGYLALGAMLVLGGWLIARSEPTAHAVAPIAGAATARREPETDHARAAAVDARSSARIEPSSDDTPANRLPTTGPGRERPPRRQEWAMSTEAQDLRKDVDDLKSAQAAQTATQAGQMATFSAMQAGMMGTMVAGSVGLIAGMIIGLMFGRSPRQR